MLRAAVAAPDRARASVAGALTLLVLGATACGEFWLADKSARTPTATEEVDAGGPRVVTRRLSAPEVAGELCPMMRSPSPARLEKLKQSCASELEGLAKSAEAIFDADAIPGCLEAGTAEPAPPIRGVADLLRLPACGKVVVGGLKEGAKCSLFPLGCAPGVFCNKKTERCERSGTRAGQPCVDTYESGAASCGPGLHCEETQAKTFCEGDRLPGAACTRSRQCKASLICAAGSCREAPGKVDEACDFLDPRACERDLYCNQKCEPRLGKGKHCTTDASCKSGDCDIGGKDVCQ